MIPCPVCGAELEPQILKDMAGNEFQQTLRYGLRDERMFFCPNAVRGDGHGVNLWTGTSIKSWVAMQKRQEKFPVRQS